MSKAGSTLSKIHGMSSTSDKLVMFDNVLQIGHSAVQQGVFAKKNIAQGTVIKNDGFVCIIHENVQNSSNTAV